MAKQALDYIENIEKESKEMVDAARMEAARMLEEAKLNAEKNIAETSGRFRDNAESMKREAWDRASAEQKDYEAETKKLVEELKASLEAHREKAIELVMSLIAG
jgi:vacuolar-type H+-ATPase subunit H